MTASSFYQIREVIHSSYLSRYLRMKTHYQNILHLYRLHVKKSVNQSSSSTTATAASSTIDEITFSKFDSDDEYGEDSGMADKYCESVFTDYLEPLIPYITKILGNVPPHVVQSFDNTYNIAYRVTLKAADAGAVT